MVEMVPQVLSYSEQDATKKSHADSSVKSELQATSLAPRPACEPTGVPANA